MRYNLKLELALACVVSLIPAMANAQAFRADRAASEGPGFKAGRLVLHPGLSLEGGYDSNVFLTPNNPEDAFILRLVGYLDVATMSPQRRSQGESNEPEPAKIDFRGGLGGSYYHYFTDRVPDNVGADAHIDFRYNPSRVFSLQIRDVFRRDIRPFSNPNTIQGATTSYGRNNNTAAVDLVGRTRGEALEGRVGYTNRFEFFDSSLFQYGNNLTHRVPASLAWRFFPTSAMVYQFDFAHQQYTNPDQVAASTTLLSNNNRVQSQVGYNGAITRTLSLTALIGYSVGFYQDIGTVTVEDFDTVTARLEARWRPRPTILVSGGYLRDIRPSFIGNFTVINRLNADASFTIAGASLLGIKTWVSFDRSGLAVGPDGDPLGTEDRREDIRFYASVWGEYRLKSWLALFFEVGYLADFTDFEYLGFTPLIDPRANYQKVEAWVGIRVFY